MQYRREIDGLRTIAVIAVILHHANYNLFSGGYVGVDIFFVISGYLITSITLEEILNNKFTFKNFYERRVRRIIPALYVMLITVSAAAFFILTPGDYVTVIRGVRNTIFLISNVYLFNNSDYFDPLMDHMPTLHTWSLSVEEQYYLIFPALLLLFYKKRNKHFKTIFIIIALVSFSLLLPNYFSKRAMFYLLQFRAWEFIIGSCCAFYYNTKLIKEINTKSKYVNLLNITGIAMVFFSIFSFTPDTPFPSIYTCLPVIGTALIILFNTNKEYVDNDFKKISFKPSLQQVNNSFVSYILSNPVVVMIGLLSYSLYLWHTPIFAYTSILRELKPIEYIPLIILTFVISIISWKFIEKPFRNRNFLKGNKIFIIALAASILIIGANSFLRKVDRTKIIDKVNPEFFVTMKERGFYLKNNFESLSLNKYKDDSKKLKLLLIGDSQAMDFINIINENHLFEEYEIITFSMYNSCQFKLGKDRLKGLSGKELKGCKSLDIDTLQNNLAPEADIIILAFKWTKDGIKKFNESMSIFNRKKDSIVYIIGNKTLEGNLMFPITELSIRSKKEATTSYIREYSKTVTIDINKYMKNDLLADTEYIYIDTPKIFSNYEPLDTIVDGKFTYYDATHLTQNGAKILGKLIADTPEFSKYRPLKANVIESDNITE